MKNLLVAGNSTMPKYVGIFNLPALITCTPSDWCRKHCYALHGRFIWGTIKAAHEWRYKQSLQNDFVSRMINEIKRRKNLKFIRVHITGDFYSSKYILKWAAIARAFPCIPFRTNTKRQDLLGFMIEELPPNFIIRESTDNTRKSLGLVPEAAISGTKGAENYFVCRDHCERCNFYCWRHADVNVVTSQVRGERK